MKPMRAENLLWAMAVLFTSCTTKPAATPKFDPVTTPSAFAWSQLAQISAPSSPGSQLAAWETWPRNSDIFIETSTSKPDCTTQDTGKVLQISREVLTLQGLSAYSTGFGAYPQHRLVEPKGVSSMEGNFEIRMNQEVCDSAAQIGITNPKGRRDLFASGQEARFKPGSKALKAYWDYDPNCHSNPGIFHCGVTALLSTPVHLTAFHLAVKDPRAPDWLWATWEHETVHHSLAPDPYGFDQDGKPTQELTSLLSNAGPEWVHYRLIGTQIAYTDQQGKPTKLGNTIIEGPIAGTSSCITCHARATTDASGSSTSIFPCNRNCDSSCAYDETSCRPDCTYVPTGEPEKRWYLAKSGQVKYIRMGFLWSANPNSPPFIPPPGPIRGSRATH